MYAERRTIPIGLCAEPKHAGFWPALADSANVEQFKVTDCRYCHLDCDVWQAVTVVPNIPPPISPLCSRGITQGETVKHMVRAFLRNYLPRHRNRVNQFLHLIGVPLAFVGTPWTFFAGAAPWWPCVCFVGGYLLQFAGHAVEGNDAGEVVFVKKLLGMPYTEYGRGAASSCDADGNDDISAG